MSVVIRKASLTDLKSIQDLNYKLFELEFNNFDPALDIKWPYSELGKNYFEKIIIDGTVWVAVNNKNIIGYLAGSIEGKPSYATKTIAELENFYIDEEFRGQGIGKKLLLEFKSYCKNIGIEEMKVRASALNINARNFYENNGFNDFEVIYKMKL